MKHQGSNSLSRRRKGEDKEEEESEEEVEEWTDEILGCGIWIAGGLSEEGKVSVFSVGKGEDEDDTASFDITPPTDNNSRKRDEVRAFDLPASISEKECTWIIRHSRQFFVRGDQLWRRDKSGQHQKVLFGIDRTRVLHKTHNKLGRRRFHPTR